MRPLGQLTHFKLFHLLCVVSVVVHIVKSMCLKCKQPNDNDFGWLRLRTRLGKYRLFHQNETSENTLHFFFSTILA